MTTPYFDIIRGYGSLHFTGSYLLETMTWPDIDMQLDLKTDFAPEQVMSLLSTFLIKVEEVKKIQYVNFLNHPSTLMPSGLYLGATYFDKNINNY